MLIAAPLHATKALEIAVAQAIVPYKSLFLERGLGK